MAPSGMVIAIWVLALGQGPKELVALPLSEDGVKPPAGLDAWKVVTAELRRSGRLGMSMAIQKKQHDFLIGPAREQARDCGTNVECLAEIGAALKADVLVAGTVDDSGVSLIAIDVKAAKRIGGSRSNRKLSKAPIKRKAASAARVLIEAIGRGTPPPATVMTPDPRAAPPTPIAEAPPPAETSAPVPPPVLQGELHIAKDQLASVSEVKVDGEALLFAGDGSMSWKGTTGTHSLVAMRSDGSKIVKDVTIEADRTTEVLLDFAIAAIPPPVTTETKEPEKKDDILSAWWFWTSIGAAVAVGATTAAVLASGAKGGPDLEGETGSIRGRY